jgi:hypothetical protein
MAFAIDRPRKSEKMTKEDFEALKKWVDKQPTKVDAAILLGLSRVSLDRILLAGTAKTETIQKIKSVISK